MNRSRPALTAALTLSAALLAAGCGDPGGLHSAGPAPTAEGPTRLWPELPPPSAPAEDYGAMESLPVKGVGVPDGDLHKVDPATVAKVDFDANPGTYSRSDSAYKKTVQKLKTCGGARSDDECPVLNAYYRDLTGDGKDDLIVGIRLPEENLDIRAYALDKRQLTQIMEMGDAVLGVELAGHEVIVRAVSSLPGYEYRTVWSWDSHQKTMLPTSDEIVRSPNAPTKKPTTKPDRRPKSTSKPSSEPSASSTANGTP